MLQNKKHLAGNSRWDFKTNHLENSLVEIHPCFFMGLLMQKSRPKTFQKSQGQGREIKLFHCLEDSGQQEIGKTVKTQILRQPEPFYFAMSI